MSGPVRHVGMYVKPGRFAISLVLDHMYRGFQMYFFNELEPQQVAATTRLLIPSCSNLHHTVGVYQKRLVLIHSFVLGAFC